MARAFDGSSSIQGSIGALVGTPGGAHTIAVIGKRGTSGTDMVLVSLETSGNSSKLAMEWGNTGNALNLVIGSSSKNTNVTVTTSDNWVFAAVNRASGTSTPRGHKYVYDTATWTHADASATAGGDSSDLTAGRIQLAQWQNTARFTGDMLIAAVWKRSLTDAEIENLAFGLQSWYASAPDALWVLDQSAIAQAVIDATGNGANQTGITATSVSTNSTPVFNYGIGASIGIGQAGAGGPTQYTQTNAGSCTPVGALVRQASKRPTGAITPTGALIRSAAKSQAGGMAPTGTVVRSAAKSMAGAITPASALANLKAALRTFAGAITPTGVLTRQTGKALGGTLTPTGTVQRSIAKLLIGAIAATGALAKQAAKRFVGSLAPTGSVANAAPDVEAKATSTANVAASHASTSAVTAKRTSSGGVT